MQNAQNEIAGVTYDIDPHCWVEKYADYLYSYAVARLDDQELSKDLVQETFLAALVKIENFERKSTERTWLTAILKNKIVDVYRKKASGLKNLDQPLHFQADDDDFFDAHDGHWKERHQPKAFGLEEFDPLMNKELAGILKQCMQKLPSLWLSVFTMKHVDDEDTEVICSELRVTASNFWVIMHRAKLNLRACLQKNWI
jgi:RNA polymerase sigma-70 factor (TIGR02943 family)